MDHPRSAETLEACVAKTFCKFNLKNPVFSNTCPIKQQKILTSLVRKKFCNFDKLSVIDDDIEEFEGPSQPNIRFIEGRPGEEEYEIHS